MSQADVISQIRSLGKKVLPYGGQLVLFGSRARGDYNKHSDWDLLVLLDKDKITLSDYDNVTYPFAELGWQIDENINPIIFTQKDWQSKQATPFYKNVMAEGISL